MSKIALLLDRDGIINIDYGYVHNPLKGDFVKGIFELCQAALAAGYFLIIVTNQAGIAHGYYSEATYLAFNRWLIAKFSQKQIKISHSFYCPYHQQAKLARYKKASFNRKPQPGMIWQAQNKFNLNLNRS